MPRAHFSRAVALLCLFSGAAAFADTPATVVTSGVSEYSLAPPKIFWHTAAYCPPEPPHAPVGPGDDEEAGGGGNAEDPELITRVPSYGGMKRKLFEKNPTRPAGDCNPYHFYSDIAADSSHVYWVDSTGLVRLSVEANAGDPVEILNATITGADNLPRAEIAMGSDAVYVLRYVTATKGDIFEVAKADGTRKTIWHLEQHCSRLSFDGSYVFYHPDPSSLYFRVDVTSSSSSAGVSTGDGINRASALFAEGLRGRPPLQSRYAFVGHGPKLYRYSVTSETSTGPIYTSTDADAEIYDITTDSSDVFFFEARPYTCPGCIFPTYTQLLFRRPRTGNGAAELIYSRESQNSIWLDVIHLTTDGTFLYWQEADSVVRLPNDAAELPKTNLRVTGIEVTQGIQDLANSVILIKGKRTFVRVYVKSDGPAVPGVTCELYGTWTGGSGGPVGPHYASGSKITVNPSPDRDDIQQSFLFDLPWGWSSETNLRLRAELNPNKVPIQASYANNSLAVGPLAFADSPRLEVQFIAWEFDWAGKKYSVDYFDHVLPTYSWIRRAYPLSSAPGSGDDPSPGFRPRLKYIFDEDLGARVDRSAEECTVFLENDDPDDDYKAALCASAYTNSKMQAMQAEYGDDNFYYGMISDEHKFPRGQASGKTSTGPVGDACCGSEAWDLDGTYADWYAGHEIGHTLGRGHPIKMADDPDTDNVKEGCGHDSGDPNYPYDGARIGPSGGSLEGFDLGDSSNLPTVLPRSTWTDLMSYCAFQWISDYTYEAMYDFMGGGGGAEAVAGAGGGTAGDLLSVFGIIVPEVNQATIHHARRLGFVGRVPPRRPGGYSLQLLDAQGGELANYPFTPEMAEDGGGSPLSFGLVVPFAARAKQLRILKAPGTPVLAMKAISSNPPAISNVHLQGAPNPVSGVVTLAWTASDPDGDTLCFDVAYSRDNGASFEPILFNVKGSSAQVDTSRLAGGTRKLRVIATDGVQSAFADSATFTMASKNPVPRILLPAEGTRVHWGTLINFAGEADDLQDGSVAPGGLQWSQGRTILGKGPFLSLDDLRVGENRISLRAENSLGLSASTSVTVIVDDDLNLPGPTLTAGPLQIGWHVGAGSVGNVTAQIGISNAGSGILNWTASEGAPWLSLSATNGAAPALVTVSANTTGVADGTTLTADIVISGPSGQSITIPASLAVGDTYTEPVGPPTGGFKRGDSNSSGKVDISDAVNTLNYLFGGNGVIACPDASDANDDGKTDISDAVATLGFLFLGAPPPPAPGPAACGPDPTVDPQPECVYEPGNC